MEHIKSLLISLTRGVDESDLTSDVKPLISDLIRKKALKVDKQSAYKLDSDFRAGKIDVSMNGTGYLEDLGNEKRRDLIVESKDLMGANRGDLVVAKKIRSKSGRQKAKIILIAQRAFKTYIGITTRVNDSVVVQNIKTSTPINVIATQKSLKQLPPNTLLKINSVAGNIECVLGVLEDPIVDEKISLSFYDKDEFFTKESEEEAKSHGDKVDKSLYPHRLDLTDLPFCTIDPKDAKDFDDAVYFDEANFTIYVAIADAGEYVFPFGNIDKEAKKRGFSIYFPHKSIPMLPRALSENICSLKPNVDRLVFGFKIVLDKNSLEPKSEELFEGIINSKKRYTYELVDKFIADKNEPKDKADELILASLISLFELTKKIRAKRLLNAFVFHSSETRMSIDENQNIVSAKIEEETPSHSLIEECMLLANKAAAKRISRGIFRTHEEPSYEKIDKLLNDLSLIGMEARFSPQIPALIRDIQAKADEMDLRGEVDKLIIKSQKQARYTADNRGHFGLGFDIYSHFTSPIRRYSDLTLHRLLKSQIKNDEKLAKFQLENIETLCERLSELEREADKVVWDFMDRKFARWAAACLGEHFVCKVTELGKISIAVLDDELKGARIFLVNDDLELFERIRVRIISVDIASAKIIGEVVQRLN